MSVAMIRDLYEYHRWANRRLFEVTAAQGEETAGREMGPQWSLPTLTRMLGHLYGADRVWLQRWKGGAPSGPGPNELRTLVALRPAWDALEQEQRAFVDGLAEADLARTVEWKNNEGRTLHLPLGPLLQHVPNHATHHRSELATMITLASSSPPDTGMATFLAVRSGQA